MTTSMDKVLADRELCREGFEIELKDCILPYILDNVKQVYMDTMLAKATKDRSEKGEIDVFAYVNHVNTSLNVFRSFLNDEGKEVFDKLVTPDIKLDSRLH